MEKRSLLTKICLSIKANSFMSVSILSLARNTCAKFLTRKNRLILKTIAGVSNLIPACGQILMKKMLALQFALPPTLFCPNLKILALSCERHDRVEAGIRYGEVRAVLEVAAGLRRKESYEQLSDHPLRCGSIERKIVAAFRCRECLFWVILD